MRDTGRRKSYRPEEKECGICGQKLKRSHIVWRKKLIYSWGVELTTSWGYKCGDEKCLGHQKTYTSQAAEQLHLKHRQYSRELIIKIGYHRFWEHRTIYELHDWLTQSLKVPITERQVLNLIGDFLALLKAGQAEKIYAKLQGLPEIVIGIDGMQPERGNKMLYLVREPQLGLTLVAEILDEGGHEILSEQLLLPLKEMMAELGVVCRGIVSDAQPSIRMAVANTLPEVPYQVCQAHCLRDAGQKTFEADRKMKKELKATFRRPIKRLRKRIQELAEQDQHRPILLNYAEALHALLLTGGLAPFDLGGVSLFTALDDLSQSLHRCQKKETTRCYNV